MREQVPCEFPAGYDGTALLDRLALIGRIDNPIKLGLGLARNLAIDVVGDCRVDDCRLVLR